MSKQTINVGTLANDKTGDALRNAFIKVNNNFTELYNHTNTDGSSLVNGDYTLALNADGTVELPHAQQWWGNGVLKIDGGYPWLIAYGQDHGGPELLWTDAANFTEYDSGTKLINTMYINETGLSIIMNTSNIQSAPEQVSWRFSPDGGLVFPDNTTQLTAYSGPDSNVWVQDFTAGSEITPAASSVEYDADGNLIAVFAVSNRDNNYSNTLVAKFDTFGAKQWEVIFQGATYTDGWGLAVSSAHSWVYVAGRLNDNNGYNKSLVSKIDLANGTLLWSKVLDFGYESDSPVVEVDSVGNPIVVGWAYNGTDDCITVSKLSAIDGSELWGKSLNSYGTERAYGMGVGSNGEIIAVGYEQQMLPPFAATSLYADPVSNVNWITGATISPSNDFTCRVDFTNGVPTFTNIIDRVGNRSVDDQIITISGSTFGGTNGVDDMIIKVAATIGDVAQYNKILVAKYDTDGNLTWQKSIAIDEEWSCQGADADVDSNGNIYVCGQFNDPITSNQAMFLFQLDAVGNGQWTRKVQGNCNDFATSVVVGSDNYLYLAGVTGNNATADFSLVIAKYDTDGVVLWQRLLDNTTTWTFGGSWWFNNTGGSNLAVKNGYVAVAGGFADPFGTSPEAILAQFNTNGAIFNAGNYDFKNASFTGSLTGSPTIINDIRADVGIEFGVTDFNPDYANNINIIFGDMHFAGSTGTPTSLRNGQFDVNLEGTGSLTFPYLPTNNRTGNAEALVFTKSNTQKSISTQAGESGNNNVERLVIAGGDSYQDPESGEWFGEGGDLYLWAGRGRDGGDIKIDAGQGQGNNGSGGYVKMRAGDAYVLDGSGGFLEFRAGNGQSNGGDVDFFAGYGAASSGTIQLHTYTPGTGTQRDWTFGTDGSLTFPTGVALGEVYGVGSGVYLHDASSSNSIGIASNNLKAYVEVQNGVVYIGTDYYTDHPGPQWTFDNNGVLTLPGAITTRNTSQVGSKLDIATNIDNGTVGWSSYSMSVAYNADILSTYTAGSTITFQDNTVATITAIEDYTSYIDISWDTPKTGTLFPITLKTSNYIAASSANAAIVVGSNGVPGVNTWTFGNDGSITFPDDSVQTTAYKIGEDVITLDGITTSFSPSTVKSLLSITAGIGYFGSDAYTISLPQGVAGQRLVILNMSTNCTGTIDGYIQLDPSSSIEVIYSAFDGSWVVI